MTTSYAENYDSVIKLIAMTKKLGDDKIVVMVSPRLIKNDSMLSGVNGVFNACLVRGDATGDVLMYGKGAGSLATASAVVGDVIDCGSYESERKFFGWDDAKENYLADYLESETSLYVRATGADKAAIETAFGSVQYLERENQPADEIAFITPVAKEKDLREKLDSLSMNILGVIRTSDY